MTLNNEPIDIIFNQIEGTPTPEQFDADVRGLSTLVYAFRRNLCLLDDDIGSQRISITGVEIDGMDDRTMSVESHDPRNAVVRIEYRDGRVTEMHYTGDSIVVQEELDGKLTPAIGDADGFAMIQFFAQVMRVAHK